MIKKIKIGCYTYDIVITDEPIIIGDKCDYTGMIDYHKNILKIKDGLSENVQKQILLHEIIHGILNYFEIDLKENTEEKIVDCLAKGIYQIMIDNKNFIDGD